MYILVGRERERENETIGKNDPSISYKNGGHRTKNEITLKSLTSLSHVPWNLPQDHDDIYAELCGIGFPLVFYVIETNSNEKWNACDFI